MERKMVVVVGSYERLLLGFSTQISSSDSDLTPVFNLAPHKAAVRCLASSPQRTILASGGDSDTVRLYDLKQMKESEALELDTEAQTTCLAFGDKSTLLSGHADGSVVLWTRQKTGWQRLKTLGAHGAAVASLAVHPSGKLALSLGERDGRLKIWDLASRRLALSARFPSTTRWLSWLGGEDGFFAVISTSRLAVFSIDSQESVPLAEKNLEAGKITAVAGLSERPIVLLGTESGLIRLGRFVKQRNKLRNFEWVGHECRVKALSVQLLEADGEELRFIIASGSSDGILKLWRLALPPMNKKAISVQLTTSENTHLRITCVALSLLKHESKPKKRKTRKRISSTVGDIETPTKRALTTE